MLKFIYSEKATKFFKIFAFLLSYVAPVKSKVKILQNFVAFGLLRIYELYDKMAVLKIILTPCVPYSIVAYSWTITYVCFNLVQFADKALKNEDVFIQTKCLLYKANYIRDFVCFFSELCLNHAVILMQNETQHSHREQILFLVFKKYGLVWTLSLEKISNWNTVVPRPTTTSWGCWKHVFGIPGVRPMFLKADLHKESKNGFKTTSYRPP